MDSDRTIAKCRRRKGGTVAGQNARSIELCGKRKGRACTDGCAEFFQCSEVDRPILRRHKLIGRFFFDILAFRDGEDILTFLFPVGNDAEETRNVLKNTRLTPREREISELILRGFTNQQIRKKLFISHATLKTHINRVYRKLGGSQALFVRSSSKE